MHSVRNDTSRNFNARPANSVTNSFPSKKCLLRSQLNRKDQPCSSSRERPLSPSLNRFPLKRIGSKIQELQTNAVGIDDVGQRGFGGASSRIIHFQAALPECGNSSVQIVGPNSDVADSGGSVSGSRSQL